MRVNVRLEGHLPQYTGTREMTLDLEPGATLRDLVAFLKIPPGEAGSAYLDGKGALPTARLHDGSRVELFPPVGGGEAR